MVSDLDGRVGLWLFNLPGAASDSTQESLWKPCLMVACIVTSPDDRQGWLYMMLMSLRYHTTLFYNCSLKDYGIFKISSNPTLLFKTLEYAQDQDKRGFENKLYLSRSKALFAADAMKKTFFLIWSLCKDLSFSRKSLGGLLVLFIYCMKKIVSIIL